MEPAAAPGPGDDPVYPAWPDTEVRHIAVVLIADGWTGSFEELREVAEAV